jgi:hypothetical protein
MRLSTPNAEEHGRYGRDEAETGPGITVTRRLDVTLGLVIDFGPN